MQVVCKVSPLIISSVIEWLLFNTNWAFFLAIPWQEQATFNDDDVHFVFGFIVLAQWHNTAGRHVAPHVHMSLIPSQPVVALNAVCLSEKQ